MPLSTLFALLNVATGAQLDQVLAELGALTTISCTVAGTDALALTPDPLTPTVAAYEHLQGFSCVAAGTSSGSVVATVGGLSTLNVYKNTAAGPVLLTGGEIVINNMIILYYDATLDSGAGGFHLGGPGGTANGALPSGGTVGQLLANTSPGAGGWSNGGQASPGLPMGFFGGVDDGSGAGNFAGQGGPAGTNAAGQGVINGGDGSATQPGGPANITGGVDGGAGAGEAQLAGGSSITTGIKGGAARLQGGPTNTGDADGGDAIIAPGGGHGTGRVGKIVINNATSTPGASTGTLTNAPAVGNAQTWLEVEINSVIHFIPAWHA